MNIEEVVEPFLGPDYFLEKVALQKQVLPFPCLVGSLSHHVIF